MQRVVRGIHTSLQFGFRSKISAQDTFLYFIEPIQHEIEIGNMVHAVLLDLSKAFDSLSHQIRQETSVVTFFVCSDTNR